MSKYKERRTVDQGALQEEQLNDRMQDDRAQLEADIVATQRKVRSEKAQLKKVLAAHPFSGAAVIECEDRILSYEKGLKRLQELLVEEFGDAPTNQ